MQVLIPVIQGYLLRAGLPFAISTQGKNGKFLLALSTKTYRDRG